MRIFFILACAALLGAPARGQGLECPAGDLLAGARLVEARHVVGDVARVTDRRAAPEGAAWDSPPAVVLDGGDAAITWDLGAAREVRGLLLQADANDRYPLSGSLDGQAFTPLAELAALADVAGLRTRTESSPIPAAVRFLRLEPPEAMASRRWPSSRSSASCRAPGRRLWRWSRCRAGPAAGPRAPGPGTI